MKALIEILEGLGGDYTSQGCVQMANTMSTWPGYKVNLRSWSDWGRAAKAISETPKDVPVMVVGYSNGGSMATYVPYTCGRVIQKLIGLDPTVWIPPKVLPTNVMQAICLKNVNPFSSFPPVGHAGYEVQTGNKVTKLLTRRIYDFHINVDKNPKNQAVVYQAAKDLLTGA